MSTARNTIKSIYYRVVPPKMRFLFEIARYRYFTDKYIHTLDIEKGLPLFQYIEIETLNRCNGKCTFCPVNVNQPQRPYAKMTWELFEKIIGELESYSYSGSINLFSNNEPFLDERILDWMRYTKEKLPDAKLIMFTNGSLLTLERFLETIKYTSHLHIDNYSDDNTVNKNLREIYDYIQKHPDLEGSANLEGCVYFDMRKRDEKLTSRGGEAPNRKQAKGIDAACFYPYKQMIIRPDGKCSLCCNDALGKYTLGDANMQTLKEIWYGEKYTQIRKTMKEARRKNLELCKHCDTHALV